MSRTQGSVFEALSAQARNLKHYTHGECKSCGDRPAQSSSELKQLQEQAFAVMQSVEHLMPLLSAAPPEVRDSLMRAIDVAKQTINRRRP